jgi:hypothetical protein
MHPSQATSSAITSPPNLLQLPTAPTIIRAETFHQNTITLTGTVQAVRESVDHLDAPSTDPDIVLTLAVYDSYAPLARRDPAPTRKRPAHTITLRLPQGQPLDGRSLSLSPRQRLRVTGYLRDHAETLSLFRVWASLKLFERLHADDGQRLLKSNDTHVIVESVTPLPDLLAPEAFDENSLILSGIAQRIWTTRSTLRADSAAPDVCVRLATYDRHAEIIPPDRIGARRRDPLGQLPTRQAHHTTLRFPGGGTLDGEAINLAPNAVLRVAAYMRSVPYRQSLHEMLTTLQQIDRLREGDDKRYLHRFTQHLVVTSCICFGAVPFDQLR